MLVVDPLTRQAVNPRLIYALEVLNKPLVPRLYPLTFSFQAAAAGNTLPGVLLQDRVPTDTILDEVDFRIEQVNNFAGNMFKPFYDVQNALAANFLILVETTGAPPSECVQITADGPVPLAHFARAPGDGCWRNPFGKQYVLGQNMNIRHTMTTINGVAGGAIPTVIRMTYKVRQIDNCCIRTMNLKDALDWLKSEDRARLYVLARQQGG